MCDLDDIFIFEVAKKKPIFHWKWAIDSREF